jgi:hypothetical protein
LKGYGVSMTVLFILEFILLVTAIVLVAFAGTNYEIRNIVFAGGVTSSVTASVGDLGEGLAILMVLLIGGGLYLLFRMFFFFFCWGKRKFRV